MPDLEPPNLVGNLEQIAHEVFDIGNEREQQLRLRLPVGGAAVAVDLDEPIVQIGVGAIEEGQKPRIQALKAHAIVQIGECQTEAQDEPFAGFARFHVFRRHRPPLKQFTTKILKSNDLGHYGGARQYVATSSTHPLRAGARPDSDHGRGRPLAPVLASGGRQSFSTPAYLGACHGALAGDRRWLCDR